MNRDDIIRMARESGMELYGLGRDRTNFLFILERFVALIEQHLRYDSIHTCHDACPRPACVAGREARAKAAKDEREACAEMVEGMDVQHPKYIAAAIRARGEK